MEKLLKDYLDARELLARTEQDVQRLNQENDFTRAMLEVARTTVRFAEARLAKAMDESGLPSVEWKPPHDDVYWSFNEDSGRMSRVQSVANNNGKRAFVLGSQGQVAHEALPERKPEDRFLLRLYRHVNMKDHVGFVVL